MKLPQATITGFTPVPVGVSEAPTVAVLDRARIDRSKLSVVTTMSDLAEQYAFYHPGIMYSVIPFPTRFKAGKIERVDPFRSFLEEYKHPDIVPLSLQVRFPCVDGFESLGHAGWNYVVHALEKPIFQAYKEWIGSVGFFDPHAGLFLRIRTSDHTSLDSLAMDRLSVLPAQLPTVPLTVFAIESNEGDYFVQHHGGVFPVLRVHYRKPVHPDAQLLADKLLAGDPTPYAVIPLDQFEDVADKSKDEATHG